MGWESGKSHPDVGKRLAGKYELVELAGAGGMAEVFRGVTHGACGFRRPVAIKRILDSLSHEREFVAMFVEEARVVSELQHPNIVQIHDFDLDEHGQYFLVMEWIQGASLLQWCRHLADKKSQTPWPMVSALIIEVLRALSGAHERVSEKGEPSPIFHRDVTPQNIMICSNGQVKLMDFGLARAMDRSRLTQPHMVKGKLSYLAPEMTKGGDPTVQSDLFSVGVVLWETLAGKKLFVGNSPVDIIRKIRDGQIPDLRSIRRDVPIDLQKIAEQALQPDAAKRFPSARAMVRSLNKVLQLAPTTPTPEGLAHSIKASMSQRAKGPKTEVLELDDLSMD